MKPVIQGGVAATRLPGRPAGAAHRLVSLLVVSRLPAGRVWALPAHWGGAAVPAPVRGMTSSPVTGMAMLVLLVPGYPREAMLEKSATMRRSPNPAGGM